MQTDFDITICGAGPIGLSLAALLVQQGLAPARIALIDAKEIEQARRDPRSIALSFGSRKILERIGAWPIAATQINQIHVSRRGHFGRTLIEREEYDLPALGYVTRYGAVVDKLDACACALGVRVIRPATVTNIVESDTNVALNLAAHGIIHSKILVQAEGGLFNQQTQKKVHRDYQQTAIVAHVSVSAAIPHRAFERFTDEGPLALLPQDDAYAMVWCVRPLTAQRLLALDDAAFLAELAQMFGTRLGNFTSVTTRHTFPLGLNAQSDPPLSNVGRTVAIGNAAQSLHPVAGQGLNLGLRDATVLAKLLAKEADSNAIQTFQHNRQTDRNATIRLTDVMARIFTSTSDDKLPQALLGMSLGVIDAIKPMKTLLAEQMMFGRRS